MALVLATPPIVSSLSLYLSVLSLGMLAMIFAPQPLVRDKRVIVAALLLLVVVVIGHGAQAFQMIDPCTRPGLTDTEWWLFSCWLPLWMRF